MSFFMATESGQTSSQPLHKEKFNVSISENDHKELRSFKHHLMQFTGLADITVSKGLGKSFEMSIAGVQKASSGDVFFKDPGCLGTRVSKLVRS